MRDEQLKNIEWGLNTGGNNSLFVTVDYSRNYLYLSTSVRSYIQGDDYTLGLNKEHKLLAVKPAEAGENFIRPNKGRIGSRVLCYKLYKLLGLKKEGDKDELPTVRYLGRKDKLNGNDIIIFDLTNPVYKN